MKTKICKSCGETKPLTEDNFRRIKNGISRHGTQKYYWNKKCNTCSKGNLPRVASVSKKCSCCGKEKLKNECNFNVIKMGESKSGKKRYGWSSRCLECTPAEGMRRCSSCKKDFPSTEEYFYQMKTKLKNGVSGVRLEPYCKSCRKVHNRKHISKDPNKNKEKYLRASRDLTDNYVKSLIKSSCKLPGQRGIPEESIELKRLIILLKRELGILNRVKNGR